MPPRVDNGLKKWLVSFLTVVILSWVGWVSAAVVESKQAQTHAADVDSRLERMEQKLDTLLSR